MEASNLLPCDIFLERFIICMINVHNKKYIGQSQYAIVELVHHYKAIINIMNVIIFIFTGEVWICTQLYRHFIRQHFYQHIWNGLL